ncbi:MAG: response regulator [Nitrososphaeraceae archaeon]
MPEPSDINSHESKHRLANIRLTEMEDTNQPSSSSLSSFNRHQHKRILIVDDNSDIAFTLRIGLENNDTAMQVYSYDNPINALIDFEPNFYDLLLIDVNMPLMDGFRLCEKLLQKDINVKVCFMTSGEINMDAAREVHPLKSIGCFIKKPITTDALARRIRAELE